jgi:hypothetical protein
VSDSQSSKNSWQIKIKRLRGENRVDVTGHYRRKNLMIRFMMPENGFGITDIDTGSEHSEPVFGLEGVEFDKMLDGFDDTMVRISNEIHSIDKM